MTPLPVPGAAWCATVTRPHAAAGVPRSDLLNQAVREFLYRLRCERDAERYALHPLTAAETAAWPNEAWPDDDTDWTEVFSQ